MSGVVCRLLDLEDLNPKIRPGNPLIIYSPTLISQVKTWKLREGNYLVHSQKLVAQLRGKDRGSFLARLPEEEECYNLRIDDLMLCCRIFNQLVFAPGPASFRAVVRNRMCGRITWKAR